MKKYKPDDYIIDNIEEIKKEMYLIRNKFNMETDESLIDSYIYQMEALNKKYQYFIRQAKKTGIRAEGGQLCSRLS